MTWQEYINQHAQILDEKLVKKTRIDHGKKKVQWVTDKPGYRVEYDKNHMPREVKITPQEQMRRERAQSMKGKINRKKTEKLAQKRREKSFDIRHSLGIEINKDAPDRVTRREKEGLVKSDIKGLKKRELENRNKKPINPEAEIKSKIQKEIAKIKEKL